MLQDVLEELSVLSRHRRLAHQKHKVAGVESTLARLESARSLDSLILHMQEKVGPSPLARWPQDVRPGRPLDGSGGTGLLDSDLRRDALFGDSAGSPQLVPGDHPSEDMDAGMETGERVEGLEGVASLMDALMRAGGDELDYESLLAVSQSMQLSM